MPRLLPPLTSLALLTLARFAWGNETAPIPLPELEVTGTRLGRPLEECPIPVAVITRLELERSGHTTLADLLRELPEIPAAPINDAIAISSTHGVVAADLRGLGSGNTLVLVNGRRTTVSANALDTSVFVDMNRFPPALLERVEILKGGASAIYGADAVAGVINLITRQQPAGGEMTTSYGNTFDTDVAEFSASLATGASRGPLGLSFGASYLSRHGLANRDRAFSRTANLMPAFVAAFPEVAQLPPEQRARYDGRSLTAANARIGLIGGQVNGQNGVNIPGLALGETIAALPGTGGIARGTLTEATPSYVAPSRAVTGGQYDSSAAQAFGGPELARGDPHARNLFNFNDYTWLVPAAERIGADLRIDYTLPAGPVLFAELGLQQNRSHTEFMPAGIAGPVPRTNPYNPFGIDVSAVWRLTEAGARKSEMNDDAASLLVGAHSAGNAQLRWNTAAGYSRDEFTDTISNAVSGSRVLAALASSAPNSALNPFGGETFRHDPALIDALKIRTWTGGWADLLTFDATLSRELVRTAAGPITVAGYVEHREERFGASSDSLSQLGDALGQGATGADARWARSASAVAAEAHLPLLSPGTLRDGLPRLALDASARIERFAGGFESGLRPSAGIIARPLPGLNLRGSVARTFRAPTLPQLFAPQSEGYANTVLDPRRPEALTGDPFDGPNVSRLVRSGGNPDLQPETGRVLQAGVTWKPFSARELVLEADWYRYDLEDLINSVGTTYVLQNELGGLGALVHRDSSPETYVNRTSQPIALLSGPNGQTTMVAPGASADVPGRLRRVDLYIVNLSRRRLVGWDFAVRHDCTTPFGRWTARAAATYTVESSDAFDRYTALVDRTGAVGTPYWRGRATVDWALNAWSAGATFVYTPSSGEHSTLTYLPDYRVLHLRVAWTSPRNSWLHGAQISGGLDDVFDGPVPIAADPPMGYGAANVARPQGRFWRVAVKQTW